MYIFGWMGSKMRMFANDAVGNELQWRWLTGTRLHNFYAKLSRNFRWPELKFVDILLEFTVRQWPAAMTECVFRTETKRERKKSKGERGWAKKLCDIAL